VLALENSWNEAEKNKDAKAISGLLAPTFSYTDSDGSFMNKEQYLVSITEPGYRPDQIVNDSMRVEVFEHAVVVTGTYKEKGAEKGKAYSRRGRFTDMWVQEKGEWLCAASHETVIGR
jgi:ketosteroid isomerase-like protein